MSKKCIERVKTNGLKREIHHIIVNHVASKLYGVNATIIIFVFVLYCIVSSNLN